MAMRWSFTASTVPPTSPVPYTVRVSSEACAFPPSASTMAITDATRSDSFNRSRPMFVNTAPFLHAAVTARMGTKSGMSAAEMTGLFSSAGSRSKTARSPWGESGERFVTSTLLPSAFAARKNAALLQSPSTVSVPGEWNGVPPVTTKSDVSFPNISIARWVMVI